MTEHNDISYDFYIFYSDFISVNPCLRFGDPGCRGFLPWVSASCALCLGGLEAWGLMENPMGFDEKKHWNTDMLWKKPWDCMEKPIETDFQTNPIEILPTSCNIFGEVRNGDQPFGWSRSRNRSCWKLIKFDKYVELVLVYSMWLYNNCYIIMHHINIVVYIYIYKKQYHIILYACFIMLHIFIISYHC